MVILNSYVKLPEGTRQTRHGFTCRAAELSLESIRRLNILNQALTPKTTACSWNIRQVSVDEMMITCVLVIQKAGCEGTARAFWIWQRRTNSAEKLHHVIVSKKTIIFPSSIEVTFKKSTEYAFRHLMFALVGKDKKKCGPWSCSWLSSYLYRLFTRNLSHLALDPAKDVIFAGERQLPGK